MPELQEEHYAAGTLEHDLQQATGFEGMGASSTRAPQPPVIPVPGTA